MKSLSQVGRDEYLTAEQGLTLLPSAIKVARRDFIGRKLLPIRFVPKETQTFSYDTLTEMGAGRTDPKYPGRETLDAVNLGRTPVNIPCHHKEFEIPKADLDASYITGTPLPTTYSDAAAYQVGLLEDTCIIEGSGTINGLYAAAGNSEATSLSWGTATNIPLSINATIALLAADHIYRPYNLLLNPTQEGYAMALIANTATPWMDWVQKRIGGQIFVSEGITAGTGLMMKANPVGMFEYVVAEDLAIETEIESVRSGKGLFGRAYVRGLPVVYQANALCKMTTI